MNDPATLAASPKPLVVDGKTYLVHPLTLSDFGDLQSWVDAQFPSPIEVANRAIETGNYNPAQQQFLLRVALEIACRGQHKIGTPEADEKLFSVDGAREILFRSISKGDPNFTREAAEALHGKMSLAHVMFLNSVTNIDLVATDPKAPTAAGATASGTKPRKRGQKARRR
jgi:hypothetical protein